MIQAVTTLCIYGIFSDIGRQDRPANGASQRSTSLAWCGVRAVQGRLRDSATSKLLTAFQDGSRMLGARLQEFQALGYAIARCKLVLCLI
jgi:hypothetical protein